MKKNDACDIIGHSFVAVYPGRFKSELHQIKGIAPAGCKLIRKRGESFADRRDSI